MRVLLYGGSFDPVHQGHVQLVRILGKEFPSTEIVLVPAKQTPHKIGQVPAGSRHRVNMLKIAFKGFSNVRVSLCEIERGGVSYSIDTVREIKEQKGLSAQQKIGFVIGDDLVAEFDKWRNPEELMEEVQLIIARRLKNPPEEKMQDAFYLDNPLWDVSSTEIKEKISNGDSLEGLIPLEVVEYIEKNGLYETGPGH